MNEYKMGFKFDGKAYFSTLGISELRTCGRLYGVANPTELNKGELIDALIAVLAGEVEAKKPTKRGAPVKNDYLNPEIKRKIDELLGRYFPEKQPIDDTFLEEYKRRLSAIEKNPSVFTFESSTKPKKNPLQFGDEVYIGQMERFGEVLLLLPLNCSVEETPLIMPPSIATEHDLRLGDIVSCRVRQTENALVVYKVTCVNNLMLGTYQRNSFDESTVATPNAKLPLFDEAKSASVTAKYLSWITPVYKGQRLCIASEPKAGKSELLYELVKGIRSCNRKPYLLVYLCAPSAENIVRYRNILQEGIELVYSTYDDDPERQVFMADFLLRRAKRLTEMGNDVVLCIDSFTALARAYNDTDASTGGKVLAGGLESKTLLYLKRYFSAGRAFANGSSLTVIGTVSTNTGNPADDLICADLLSVANAELRLSSDLARERLYPAVDVSRFSSLCEGVGTETVLKGVREEFLPRHGEEALRKLLDKTINETVFVEKIMRK